MAKDDDRITLAFESSRPVRFLAVKAASHTFRHVANAHVRDDDLTSSELPRGHDVGKAEVVRVSALARDRVEVDLKRALAI